MRAKSSCFDFNKILHNDRLSHCKDNKPVIGVIYPFIRVRAVFTDVVSKLD